MQTINMHNTIEEADELDETLSLCDLPLYSDQSADWDQDLSLASNSMSSSQEDYFEFFSQEFNPSSTTAATATVSLPENIIFCGKLIPYKQPATRDHSSNSVEIKIQTVEKRKRRWRRLLRWKVGSTTTPKRQVVTSKNVARGTTTLMQQSSNKRMYNTNKLGKGNGRMPVFTASPSGKAKWYLLLFGISRFPPVVEFRDIKSRQRSRRQCPPPSPPMFGSDQKVINDRGWGYLWGMMIRALSCSCNHQSTNVTADGGASLRWGR